MFSKLKLELNRLADEEKYEIDKIKYEFQAKRRDLTSKCTHKYDDGRSAKTMHGDQRESYYKCAICDCSMY